MGAPLSPPNLRPAEPCRGREERKRPKEDPPRLGLNFREAGGGVKRSEICRELPGQRRGAGAEWGGSEGLLCAGAFAAHSQSETKNPPVARSGMGAPAF